MCMVVGPSALFRPLATFYEPRARLRRAAGTPAARRWRACGALGGLLSLSTVVCTGPVHAEGGRRAVESVQAEPCGVCVG